MKHIICVFTFLIVGLLSGCSSLVDASRVPAESSSDDVSLSSARIDLSDGPGIAALFNTRYNESVSSCIQPVVGTVRGYYFCTGVLLRTVDNGNFNPWEYSPSAVRLRGVSFSWIRNDVPTRNLYHSAGFILLSPTDNLNQVVTGVSAFDYAMCVYPFDAWTTRTMDRGYSGCDFEGTLQAAHRLHWGSCDDKLGYTSAAQWNAHFIAEGKINYRQCSWNADNPQGWKNMIESRRSFNDQSPWNEVMLEGPPVGLEGKYNEGMRAWVTAFFYDANRADGLATARVFQQKLATAVGRKRVPILKVDFAAPPGSRFQFVTSDQVVYP